jgi:frataxin-like iron-binding protein CyaY
MEQNNLIIQRFDEVLSSKASKISLESIQNSLSSYLTLSEFSTSSTHLSEFQTSTQASFTSIKENLEELSKKLDRDVKLAVKNATNYLSNELKKSSGKGYVNREAVLELISDKVDKVEMMAMMEFKGNKQDLETNMSAVEMVHKQVQNLVTILLEIIAVMIDEEYNLDSEKTKIDK